MLPRFDPVIWSRDSTQRCEQVLPLWGRVDQGVMLMKEYSIFPKLQDCSLTIRWFSIIPRTLVGAGVTLSAETQSVYSEAPVDRVVICIRNTWFNITVYKQNKDYQYEQKYALSRHKYLSFNICGYKTKLKRLTKRIHAKRLLLF